MDKDWKILMHYHMHFRGATLVHVFGVQFTFLKCRFQIRVLLLRKQRETKNITVSRMKKAEYVYL